MNYKILIRDRLTEEEISQRLRFPCGICGAKAKDGTEMCVDVSEYNQEIRGTLCKRCRSGLHYFWESEAALIKAREYLNKYSNR